MPLTAPTLIQPISACNENVEVRNLLLGAEIEILDDAGASVASPVVVTHPNMRVRLTQPFDPGRRLIAVQRRQIPGGDREESRSRPIPVQPQAPDLHPPVPLSGLQACMSCLAFGGVAPGGRVVALRDDIQVGQSIDAASETLRVNFDVALEVGEFITFVHQQCGEDGSSVRLQVLEEGGVDRSPVFVSTDPDTAPLKACAIGFRVEEVTHGVSFRVERTGGLGGGGCLTATPAPLITLPEPLVEGESVGFGMGHPLCDRPPQIDVEGTVAAEPPRRPVIDPLLCEGTIALNIRWLEPGARVEIEISDSGTFEANVMPGQPVELPTPLRTGQEIVVRQFLCALSAESEVARVGPAATEIPQGRVETPLVACAALVLAEDLTPGATAEIVSEQLGPISARCRVTMSRHAFAVAPSLIEGDRIFVRQYPCAGRDPTDGPEEQVIPLSEFPELTVTARAGDDFLTIDNAVLGARIDARHQTEWLGGALVESDRGQRIALSRSLSIEDGEIQIVQVLCGMDAAIDVPVLRPCPETPALETPAEGATWVDPRRTTFEWSDPGAGTLAEAEAWSIMLRGSPVEEDGAIDEHFVRGLMASAVREDLLPFHDYQWEVIARHPDCPDGTPSLPGRFRTRPEEIEFELIFPDVILGLPGAIPELTLRRGAWLLGTGSGAVEPFLINDFSTRSSPTRFSIRPPTTDRRQRWSLDLDVQVHVKIFDAATETLRVDTPVELDTRPSRTATVNFPPNGRGYRATCQLMRPSGVILPILGRPRIEML